MHPLYMYPNDIPLLPQVRQLVQRILTVIKTHLVYMACGLIKTYLAQVYIVVHENV